MMHIFSEFLQNGRFYNRVHHSTSTEWMQGNIYNLSLKKSKLKTISEQAAVQSMEATEKIGRVGQILRCDINPFLVG